jgi:hypothetical protein
MREFAAQSAVVVGVLASCFLGPVLALFFMFRRKRQARLNRRSPIGIALLRSPGYSLREQLDQAGNEVMFDVMLLMVIPLMGLAVFLAQSHLRGLESMVHVAPVYGVGVLGFVIYIIRKLVKAGARLDNLKAGYDAEVAVGQELDQLMRQGAVTFHDIPAGNFNIDHVVISSEGVFAVETKGFTKPKQGRGKANATVVFDGKVLRFPTWTTSDPLEQAVRQASWLAKWLTSAVESPVYVTPVVALPGWYVERTGRGDVRVFNGKELVGLLRSRGIQPLVALDVERIAHQVEQRCRTVAPLYAGEEKAT